MTKNVKCQSSKWIEQHIEGLGIDIDSPEFQSVKNFPLIWNIYESAFFGKDCIASANWDKDNACPVDECASATFQFFKSRYFESDGAIERFKALKIPKAYICTVKNTLAAENPSMVEVNKACRMIVQRLRNNFFHGEKEIRNIASQIELFECANWYLIGIIDNRVQET